MQKVSSVSRLNEIEKKVFLFLTLDLPNLPPSKNLWKPRQ